jgi:hypothetical protein
LAKRSHRWVPRSASPPRSRRSCRPRASRSGGTACVTHCAPPKTGGDFKSGLKKIRRSRAAKVSRTASFGGRYQHRGTPSRDPHGTKPERCGLRPASRERVHSDQHGHMSDTRSDRLPGRALGSSLRRGALRPGPAFGRYTRSSAARGNLGLEFRAIESANRWRSTNLRRARSRHGAPGPFGRLRAMTPPPCQSRVDPNRKEWRARPDLNRGPPA